MDHLKSSQERRDRWYAKHIKPRYVPTTPANVWSDLWDDDGSYNIVKSLPFQWVGHQPCNENKGMDLNLSQKMKQILDCHGFMIVSGVLGQQECDQAMEAAWDWIEVASDAEREQDTRACNDNSSAVQPVRRQDISTLDSTYFPRSVEGGMMPFCGAGHSKFAWMIRSNPKVKRVFEAFHEEYNLLSSLDGIVLWRSGSKFRTDPGWFHLDQNPRYKAEQCCIQGLVNLLPTNAQTGGNVVVAQSHKLFPHHYHGQTQTHGCSRFYHQRLNELGGEDWMEIDPNDHVLLGDQSKVISCMLGPGDMLLWDSRTVHCSYPAATANGTACQSGLIRAATAVSMMPAKGVPKDVLQARKLAVEQSRTLTHWVNKVAPLGEEHLEHVQREKACVATMMTGCKLEGVPCPLVGFEDLTEEQRHLVLGID